MQPRSCNKLQKCNQKLQKVAISCRNATKSCKKLQSGCKKVASQKINKIDELFEFLLLKI